MRQSGAKGCALEPVPAGPVEGGHVVPGLAVDLQIGRRLACVLMQDVEDLLTSCRRDCWRNIVTSAATDSRSRQPAAR